MNDQSKSDQGMLDSGRRKGSSEKRASSVIEATEGALLNVGVSPPPSAPCGACKFLRRKCISGCIFAPHFGSDQGAARFAAVHKVFGASNVSKLLLHLPENRRNDAVVTISYEAQARLSDPVYGCVSTILALQQQVASLQAELAVVQTQLMNSRLAMANALRDSQAIQQQKIVALQPAYSNTSAASNTLMNINSFNSNFDLVGEAAPSNSFDPVHLSQAPQEVEEEDEEESQNHLDFTSQIFHQDNKTFF
ncbi:LOB domain-containing protein 20 [Coffea eugenioides]|uniref:LOB domain-containing protein 20 n=1 Tax=Coffea eugenioides TaxID=49369 RepID=UPI000F609E69|nr:LOB domain-containing protein 20 [Coffea eugenioides]